jgi:hypothetical protein
MYLRLLIPFFCSYYEAYSMLRRITGIGKGRGPIVVIHEGFEGIAAFKNFMRGADRLALDRKLVHGLDRGRRTDVLATLNRQNIHIGPSLTRPR